jgi:hypothetical protein
LLPLGRVVQLWRVDADITDLLDPILEADVDGITIYDADNCPGELRPRLRQGYERRKADKDE